MERETENQEEIDYDLDMWEQEHEWRRSLPRHSDVEWLSIFPEAKARWGKIIEIQMISQQQMLEQELDDIQMNVVRELKLNKEPYRDDLWKDYGRRETVRIKKALTALQYRLKFLKTIGRPTSVKPRKIQITPDMIAHAKEYPLEQLVHIHRQFTTCIEHNDAHPSAYCKNNFLHCFVCQKSWDTIGVVMAKEGLSFKDAVMRLQ